MKVYEVDMLYFTDEAMNLETNQGLIEYLDDENRLEQVMYALDMNCTKGWIEPLERYAVQSGNHMLDLVRCIDEAFELWLRHRYE